MNKKLKAVEIEGFRAYDSNQKFEFIHKDSGEIADFVVIYAPNGYGKTSFFDAVEWAVTDKIDRITGNLVIKNEVMLEDGYVLKNKRSSLKQGTIKIWGEENALYQVSTKPLTGNMKNDYKPGVNKVVTEAFSGLDKEKETFCTTNLLAHDKITGFLQTYTAKDKSKALEIFWDPEKDSEILEKLSAIEIEIEKQQKQVKEEIKKIKKELKSYKFETSKYDEVIDEIDKYNKSNNNKIELSSDFNEILKYIDLEKGNVSNTLREVEKTENLIKVLIDEYAGYSKKVEEEPNLEKIKNEINNKLSTLARVEELQKNNKILEKRLEEFQLISEKWNSYTDILTKIENGLKENRSAKEAIDNCKKNEINETNKITKNKLILDKKNERVGDIDKQIKEIENDLDTYSSLTKQVGKKGRRLELYKQLRDARNRKVIELRRAIDACEKYLGNKKESSLFDYVNKLEINKKHNELQILLITRDELEGIVKKLEDKYKSMLSRHNKINQLVVKGMEIIEESAQCTCPLCHAKYDSYAQLLEALSESDSELNDINELKIEIANERDSLQKNKDNIELTEKQLNEYVTSIIDELNSKYKKQTINLEVVNIKINELDAFIIQATQNYEFILAKYKLCTSECVFDKKINKQLESLHKQRGEIVKEIKEIKDKIVESQKELGVILKEKNKQELSLIENDEKVSSSKEIPIYRNVNLFLARYSIDQGENHEYTHKIILNEIKNIQNNIDDGNKELEVCLDKVPEKKEDVQEELNNITIKYAETKAVCNEYRNRYAKVFGNEVVEYTQYLSILRKKEKELLEERKSYNENTLQLDRILLGIDILKKQNIWNQKHLELENSLKKEESIKSRLEKVKAARDIANDFIENKINRYFNADIINQIYTKIDPHPMMNHIKFEPVFINKKHGVNIYTFDENEKDKMSPVLYLSSAQVNILSLCIFLAKVLTVKDTTLKTIFMDDPIQHLDGINLLAFIDLLRTITTKLDRQVIISTHNESFYKLLRIKFDERFSLSRFIELNSVGEVVDDN